MKTENLLSVEQLCLHYEVEASLLKHMNEYGLIEWITVNEMPYISLEQLRDIERIIRMYHDLQVNLEGIDIILTLLKRIMDLQGELAVVKERLSWYEE